MICVMYFISQSRKKRTKKIEEEHDDRELKTALIVPYSCDVIMNILTDFCRYDYYVPDIVESTVYERNKNIHKVRFIFRVLFLHITSYIEHTIKDNEILWRLDPNFKDIFFQENYGSWVVTPIGVNQSRINYRVKMNATLPFFDDMVREQAFRRATEWIVEALKRVENPQQPLPWYMHPCFSCFWCIKPEI